MYEYEDDEPGTMARAIFGGLAPKKQLETPEYRASRSHNPTMPILLVGSMALSLAGAATGVIDVVKPEHKPDASADGERVLTSAAVGAKVAALPAPASYTVAKGDTISAIAKRYGLTTSTVLSLNGLRTNSLIFPGQKLKLLKSTAPAAVAAAPIATAPTSVATGSYTIAKGDTISRIATKYGVTTQAILTANSLAWSSIIYPGQKLVIPGTGAAAPAPVLAAKPVSSVTPAPTPPVVVAQVVVPTPPVAVNGSYVIQSGDNLSKIATKFGVTLAKLLAANGLTTSSIIYSGRTLVIPGVATTTTTAGVTNGITLLSDEQEGNAAVIIAVGRELGVPDYGIVIALATAMQESSLRNISYGDRDSVGLFQQRPSYGWGTVSQLTTPSHAARLFYGGSTNPNKGITRGLLDISGWQAMTLTQAAQKVQVSAYPTAYAKWEASARVWFSDLA